MKNLSRFSSLGLIIILTVGLLSTLTNDQLVQAQVSSVKVTWELERDGIIRKSYIISVQNQLGYAKDFDIASLFENLSFPAGQLSNVKFYEWKNVKPVDVPVYDNVAESFKIENVVAKEDFKTYENLMENGDITVFYGDIQEPNFFRFKVSDNRENVGAGFENLIQPDNIIQYTIKKQVGTVTKYANDWKPCKMLLFEKTDKTYKENYGLINIPKFGSKPKYDDFGNVKTENGIKRFRLEFDVPIVRSEKGWGSSGKVALLTDGAEFHPWWESNWHYKKSTVIKGTTAGAQDNYQMKLVVHKGTRPANWADNENHVFLDNHGSFDNFQDVRLVLTDNVEFALWIESISSDNENAIFWGKAPNIPASPDNISVSIYYNNSNATSLSNGSATFAFFDACDTLDAWTVVNGTWSADGVIHQTDEVGETQWLGGLRITSPPTLDARKVSAKMKIVSTSENRFVAYSGKWSDIDNFLHSELRKLGDSPVIRGHAHVAGVWKTEHEAAFDPGYGIWHRLTTKIDESGNVKIDADGVEKLSFTDADWDQTWTGVSLHTYATLADFDDIFVAKHASPEPTWGAWGGEESRPNAPTSLLCEGQTNPTRIIDFTPEFSAIFTDNDANDNAENMEIWVGTTEGDNNMWASGWIDIATTENNTRCPDVSYAGSTLSRGVTYYWKCRFMDVAGYTGAWSTETATFRLNQLPFAENQKAEGLVNPTRLITFTPTLSWDYADPDSDAQSQRQIQVGISENDNSKWDSTVSTSSTSAVYGGSALSRGVTYYWRVRVYDGYEWSSWLYGGTFKLNQLPLAENLKIENADAPTRLTTFAPDFTWDYGDPDTDNQENYRIIVGTSLGDNLMWDNTGGALTSITYAGAALSRGVTYFVSVRTHDNYEWGEWENDNFRLNQLPTCSIASPPDGFAAGPGEGIQFTSGASDPDADPLTYYWQFGDGGDSSEANPKHTYASVGDYTVIHQVSDGYENSSVSITISVRGTGPGGGGGPTIVGEIGKAVEFEQNILFRPLFALGPLPVQLWMLLAATAAVSWKKDQKGIAYSCLMILAFLLAFGGKIF